MKILNISIDCSTSDQYEIDKINNFLRRNVLELLNIHYPVKGMMRDGVFLKIYIDVENASTGFLDTTYYCREFVARFLFCCGYDKIVSVFSAPLPKELENNNELPY